MLYGTECCVEENVVWKKMLCGRKCCVEENVVWKQMLCGSECYLKANVLWKRMLYGSECCVEVNVNGSDCCVEANAVWNRMLYGRECCVEANVQEINDVEENDKWKSMRKIKKKVIKKKSVVGIRTSYLHVLTQESNQCARTSEFIIHVVWFKSNHIISCGFWVYFFYMTGTRSTWPIQFKNSQAVGIKI